jgi:arsenate reductase (thioredoxin)
MAEAFARAHGSDVLEAQSAGLAPALALAPLTHAVMLEKEIDLGDYYPKEMGRVIDRAGDSVDKVDLIINMSGYELQLRRPVPVEEWDVRDPIGQSEETFREVRDEIERRVLQLIERLRSRKTVGSEAVSTAARVDSRRRPTRQ